MSDLAVPAPAANPVANPFAGVRRLLNSPRMSGNLIIGVVIFGAVLLLCLIGGRFVDPKNGQVAAMQPTQKPSLQHWLGSDTQGRDLFTVLVIGTPQTLRIGLIAGAVGVAAGLVLGLIAGYFGGAIDAVIRIISDSLMTAPGIAILLVIATNVDQMTVDMMGLTVAALAWMFPLRAIRAQVLSIRERTYVNVARANGESELAIVFREILPNLIPYVAASFVAAVGHAMLASVGLEALGLGANDQHTLGATIYWSQKYASVLRGLWWWFAPPIAMIAIIFVGLFFISSGMDKIANPRLRQQT